MKIGLLTPYGGTNLGDAAIQESVIYNIQKRRPHSDIVLISLNPELTTQIHGVPSFPITSMVVNNYSSRETWKKRNTGSEQPNLHLEADLTVRNSVLRLKAFINKFPPIYTALKNIYQALLTFANIPRLLSKEISHFLEAHRAMKGTDIVLVSGGGQIDDYWGGAWGHPYSLFKWSLITRLLGARYVFLGVGTCSIKSKLSKFFIYFALRSADYRSFRDNTSKKLLESMSLTRNDIICPDLAYSFERARIGAEKKIGNISGKTIGVNLIAHMRHNMPKKDLVKYERYLNKLTEFIIYLLISGYSIKIFLTDSPDRHVVNEILNIIEKNIDSIYIKNIAILKTENIDNLFEQLNGFDYIVATRLHAVLLSHLAKKPVLVISYDRKVNTYMNDINLYEFCYDIDNINVKELIISFNKMVSESKKIINKLNIIDDNYRILLEKQYDTILGC